MLDTMKNRTHRAATRCIEKFGVPPDKVVDVQALAGDSTDNVPGVPGIGVKTAAELINEYGDLETLLARAGEIKQPKRREKLIEFADAGAHLARARQLKDDVPRRGAGSSSWACAIPSADAARLPARDGVHHADQAHRRRAWGRAAAADSSGPVGASVTAASASGPTARCRGGGGNRAPGAGDAAAAGAAGCCATHSGSGRSTAASTRP